MAIDFPASPTNGQTFTVGSVTYTWDGTKWTAVASGGAAVTDKIEEGNTSAEVIDTGSDGRFVVTTEGSERARVDSSGRLLVGTSTARSDFFNTSGYTPTQQLEVVGTNVAAAQSIVSAGTSNWPAYLVLGKHKGSVGGTPSLVADGENIGHISFQAGDGSEMVEAATIAVRADGVTGANDMPGRLVFSTTPDGASSPTERMRIRNDGNVGIANNGNANVRLFVNAPVSDSNNWSIFGNNAAGTNALGVRGDGAIYCGLLSHSPYNLLTAGAANAVLMSDGYFYRSTSSAKYKKDIETIDYAYSEALLNCRPVWYRSTSNADNPEWGWWGFIAEEVASIDPRLVHWKTTEPVAQENGTPKHAPCEPEPEGVAYDRFVPHLLNLIKRQKERIETLETQNASFEARLTALEGGQP